jgi:hypothetical protein
MNCTTATEQACSATGWALKVFNIDTAIPQLKYITSHTVQEI